jgi:hypothetical protein
MPDIKERVKRPEPVVTNRYWVLWVLGGIVVVLLAGALYYVRKL